MKYLLFALVALLIAAGCGDGGGKIEPESKGGSPIMNRDKAAAPPANP